MIHLMIYYIPYRFSDAPRDLISLRLKPGVRQRSMVVVVELLMNIKKSG